MESLQRSWSLVWGQHAALLEAVLQSHLVECLCWATKVAMLAWLPAMRCWLRRGCQSVYSCVLVMFGAIRHLSIWSI